MNDRFKFRQPVYGKGKFERFHYWGRNTEDGTTFAAPETNNGFKDYKQDEQCTGLKDKNGTLIYEGDIVKGLHTYKLLVKIDDIGVKYEVLQGELSEFIEQYLAVDLANNEDSFIYEKDVEIIGNIHENPELLK